MRVSSFPSLIRGIFDTRDTTRSVTRLITLPRDKRGKECRNRFDIVFVSPVSVSFLKLQT